MSRLLSDFHVEHADKLIGSCDVEVWYDERLGKWVIQVGDEDYSRHFLSDYEPDICKDKGQGQVRIS